MSSTNSDLDSEIIEQARFETAEKYRLFIDEVYEGIASQNAKINFEDECFSGLEPFKFLEQNARTLPNENALIQEHTNYFELLQTCGNTHLNKLLLVFAALVDDLNELAGSASNYINPLLLYREECNNGSADKSTSRVDLPHSDETNTSDEEFDEDEYTATASILFVLFDIIRYLRRCYDVATNLLLQKHIMLSYATSANKSSDDEFKTNLRKILPDLSSNMKFNIVWAALANIATALINLDQVFASQANALRRDIHNYKRSLEMISKNLPQFELDGKANQIQALLTMLDEVQRELFDGRIAGNAPIDPNSGSTGQDIDFLFFKGLVIAILNTNLSENGSLVRNVALMDNIAAYIKLVCLEAETNSENFIDEQRLLSATTLYAVYFHLYWRDADRRLLKSLHDAQRKSCIHFVHLSGNVSISPDQLLIRTLPRIVLDKRTIDQFASHRETLMRVGHMEAQVRAANVRISQWLVSMEQSLNAGYYSDPQDGDTLQLVFSHINQWKDGIGHTRQLSNLVRDCVAMHSACQRPVSRADSIAICKAVCMLKGMQRFFQRHKRTLIEATSYYQKYSACAMLKTLTRVKEKIIANVNNYSEQKLDLLSAVILAANCLNGPVLTVRRYNVTALCVDYAMPYAGVFTTDDLNKLLLILRRIQLFINVFGAVRRMFDCEFLYFNRAIMQVYFQHYYDQSSQPSQSSQSSSTCLANVAELQYFFAALDDALPLLSSPARRAQSRTLIATHVDDIFRCFRDAFLAPFCKDFEDELRYRTHSHLKVGDKNPFVAARQLTDFRSLLAAEPFRIGGGRRIVWIKRHVERYLTELAYNMTAIALHDWKTYEAMLAFARDKFALEFACTQLPTQTLEQGLDVLEITRNLHVFVGAYLYNLNNQFFVERSSSNKHLNVLTIRHVANSIQTHGFGVINSTVNFAYQFLRKKLQTLSHFLFEEHIKSRLIKDIRHFRELIAKQEASATTAAAAAASGANLLVKFPFERAEKFAKGIRRLGVSGDGVTYLDKFRQLLTQIGNVLGFVRMLRSGALHCTSEIANFVPDLDDLGQASFEQLARDEATTAVADETLVAAKNFDAALGTIATNFSDATDYFRLLIDVFAPTMRDAKRNAHMRNFFVVLPATTYNYVQHIIVSKERLAKSKTSSGSSVGGGKQEMGAIFTDDGFAMGAIYVLKLLDQLNDFDSLQWFGSVDDHVRQAIARSNQIASGGDQANLRLDSSGVTIESGAIDDKLRQTTSLTIRRLQMFHREFHLLKYGMTSCRILFKSAN